MSKTHAEIRNENIQNELFIITDEMKKAMEKARQRGFYSGANNRTTGFE